MNYRYSPAKKAFTRLYRKVRPSVDSKYTSGPVEDICSIELTDPARLGSFFERCMDILRSKRGNYLGDYMEFGVFNGSSLAVMYQTAKKASASMRFFGFDSFEGLPPGAENGDKGVFRPGFYSCSLEELEGCLKRRNIDSKDINLVKGFYDDTLNQELAGRYNFDPGLVFIDCDTYESSKSVLDFIGPLIKRPMIISLDDWRLYDLDLKGEGEYRAFNEFLEANPQLNAKEISTYKRNSRTFLIIPN